MKRRYRCIRDHVWESEIDETVCDGEPCDAACPQCSSSSFEEAS